MLESAKAEADNMRRIDRAKARKTQRVITISLRVRMRIGEETAVAAAAVRKKYGPAQSWKGYINVNTLLISTDSGRRLRQTV
jgi:hypothetical protein